MDYIPADTFEIEQFFIRRPRLQKPVRFPVNQNECVHKVTLSFFSPATLETSPYFSETLLHVGTPCGCTPLNSEQ